MDKKEYWCWYCHYQFIETQASDSNREEEQKAKFCPCCLSDVRELDS